jgi:hypothetical protein
LKSKDFGLVIPTSLKKSYTKVREFLLQSEASLLANAMLQKDQGEQSESGLFNLAPHLQDH